MRATIIGAGITGLTIAAILERLGIDYEIFEASPELKPVGAGIIMSPNPMYIFDRLGLHRQIEEAGFQLPRFHIASRFYTNIIQRNDLNHRLHGKLYHAYGIHRSELQRILLSQIDQSKLTLGKALQHVDPKTNLITFKDGKTHTADYVLGCDGINSPTRQSLFPNADLRYSGQTCWRGVLHMDISAERKINLAELWGTHRRFGFVPIQENQAYWYATETFFDRTKLNQPIEPTDPKALAKRFRYGFSEYVSETIASTPPQQIVQHHLYDLKPLKTWHHGAIMLLGDAAHAMTPNLGQGAAQGIEDAWSFCNQLAITRDPQAAFTATQKARKQKIDLLVKRSKQIGQVTNSRILQDFTISLMKWTPKRAIEGMRAKMFDVPAYHGVIG